MAAMLCVSETGVFDKRGEGCERESGGLRLRLSLAQAKLTQSQPTVFCKPVQDVLRIDKRSEGLRGSRCGSRLVLRCCGPVSGNSAAKVAGPARAVRPVGWRLKGQRGFAGAGFGSKTAPPTAAWLPRPVGRPPGARLPFAGAGSAPGRNLVSDVSTALARVLEPPAPANVQVQGRYAASSRSVPCNAVLGLIAMTLPRLVWRRSLAHELPNAVIEVGSIN
jgi:hypothetical protein